MAGGRPTGSMNKNSKFLLNRLQAMYGEQFHPIRKMAQNASAMQARADSQQEMIDNIAEDETLAASMIETGIMANEAWDKITPYIEPKLKQVEASLKVTEIPHEDWLEELTDD